MHYCIRTGMFGAVLMGLVLSCQPSSNHTKPILRNQTDSDSTTSNRILISGLSDTSAIRQQADELGLTVSGSAVLIIEGPGHQLNQLTASSHETTLQVIRDEAVAVDRDETPVRVDEQVSYLAKKEFGLVDHWSRFPTHDGRGVTVGVIDDGISPVHDGFKTTTTGERKFIGRSSSSTRLQLPLEHLSPEFAGYASTYQQHFDKAWVGLLDENRRLIDDRQVDYNQDQVLGEIPVAVFAKDESIKMCVDTNTDHLVQSDECFAPFAKSGEFGFWSGAGLVALLGEFDANKAILTLSEGERQGDGHGEGVATVMAGHKIAGRFDGIAPGAKILDYDIGESSHIGEETMFTMATFIKALDWMGQHGAEVVNISYSLFFYSATSQRFMQHALQQLIDKYNYVITFSAGNNGPGLGSFNRGLIYPASTLVAAAFVSRELDELVHGVTGLPDPGRIVFYSSRGPSPDLGTTPTIASPLASLVHLPAGDGFRAFSGTSSAAPAAGGLAANVISAAKQAGLPIDAAAIVHALRSSAQPLDGVPYVEQGYGMPNMERALAAYRRIIAGKEFAHVETMAYEEGPNGVRPSGLLFKTSQGPNTYEQRLQIRGHRSSKAPGDTSHGLLKTVEFRYSHPWIYGPSKGFVSQAGMSLSAGVDVSRFDHGQSEGLGAIQVIDSESGRLLETIPVTVVNDRILNTKMTLEDHLEAESASRFHFQVQPGTSAIAISAETLQGRGDALVMRVYNPSGRIIFSGSGAAALHDVLVPLDEAGWYQVAFGRSKGTVEPLVYRATVAPRALALESRAIANPAAPIHLANHSDTFVGRVTLSEAPALIGGPRFISVPYSQAAEAGFTATRKGFYRISAKPAANPQVSYFYASCVAKAMGDERELLSTRSFSGSTTLELTSEPGEGGEIQVSCRPFDHTGLENTTTLVWHLEAAYLGEAVPRPVASTVVRMKNGFNAVQLPWLQAATAGQEYILQLAPVTGVLSPVALGSIVVAGAE